jgi:hypothetical protein
MLTKEFANVRFKDGGMVQVVEYLPCQKEKRQTSVWRGYKEERKRVNKVEMLCTHI